MERLEIIALVKTCLITIFLIVFLFVAMMLGAWNQQGVERFIQNYIDTKCPMLNYSVSPGGFSAALWLDNPGVSGIGSVNITTEGIGIS